MRKFSKNLVAAVLVCLLVVGLVPTVFAEDTQGEPGAGVVAENPSEVTAEEQTGTDEADTDVTATDMTDADETGTDETGAGEVATDETSTGEMDVDNAGINATATGEITAGEAETNKPNVASATITEESVTFSQPASAEVGTEEILPFAGTVNIQVSSWADLQAAITGAATDGTETSIEIAAGIQLENELIIATGQNIKIWAATPYTLKAAADLRLFTVNGMFTLMDNVTLEGNTAIYSNGGGVLVTGAGSLFTMDGGKITKCKVDASYYGLGVAVCVINNGAFVMNNGEISENNGDAWGKGSFGGGVYVGDGATFTMNNGKIVGNTATRGMGVYVGAEDNLSGGQFECSGVFIMNGGEISGNTATPETTLPDYTSGVHVEGCRFVMNGGIISNHQGGGVRVGPLGGYTGTFEMTGGEICWNTRADGGGLFIAGIFTMSGGKIHHNTASQSGGGICLNDYDVKTVTITGGEITDNSAGIGGGGISTYPTNSTLLYPEYSYRQLDIGAAVVFSGNTAGGYPRVYDGAPDVSSNIKTSTSSIAGLHPLNNYDIIYSGGIEAVYTVTFKDYDGAILKTQWTNNGGGATAPPTPTREGYTFAGWDVDFSSGITSDLIVTATYTEQTTQDELDDILEDPDDIEPEDILDTINNLEDEDWEDEETLDKIKDAEEIYKDKQNITVEVVADPNTHGDFKQNVSVVGAAFNAQAGQTVTLHFSKPAKDVVIDGTKYKTNSAVQVDISLEGVPDPESLKTPVFITVPIPSGISPDNFFILHHHANGTVELISPTVNGDGTCSFTVTSFSVFAFVNGVVDPGLLPEEQPKPPQPTLPTTLVSAATTAASPQTGDSSNTMGWIIACVVSGIACAAVLAVARKKPKQDAT